LKALDGAGLPHEYTLFDAHDTADLARRVKPRPGTSPLLTAFRRAIDDAPPEYATYLEEAMGCYEHQHYRATVLMIWCAVREHLSRLVERRPGVLAAFEAENKRRNRDGEARGYRKIRNMGDLRNLPDRQFIDTGESAGLYDGNVRRVLVNGLELRNLCGHPTGYAPTERRTHDYIDELVVNVLGAHGMLHRRDRPPVGPFIPTQRHSIPKSVRNQVWERDGGRCVECGSQKSLQYDHILPLAMGGSNALGNLELRCASCNQKKGGRI
jgi:HNH endonuclease